MNVCVLGLWHLGTVTAACMASVGHNVIGLDDNQILVARLRDGNAPLFEPGLDALLSSGLQNGCLSFASDMTAPLSEADFVWVAFDTPVDENDQADVDFVSSKVKSVLNSIRFGAIVLLSSQMPVGSTKEFEQYALSINRGDLQFVCCPENLRLGNAINVFLNPDRIVLGIRNSTVKEKLEMLFEPITDRLEWMSVESAEMTKHAINSFLAVSVTFANEIAAICEIVGADAKEVERGLKTEARIGTKAYLAPGGPFAGGTLARDIEYLVKASSAGNINVPMISSVKVSNGEHALWVRRKLLGLFPDLNQVEIAIWGLTYKAGTSTLRRSQSVELCSWLISKGANLRIHDPAATDLPISWNKLITRYSDAVDAVDGAQILIVGTEWPDYRSDVSRIRTKNTDELILVDANRYLKAQVDGLGFRYIAVGSV